MKNTEAILELPNEWINSDKDQWIEKQLIHHNNDEITITNKTPLSWTNSTHLIGQKPNPRISKLLFHMSRDMHLQILQHRLHSLQGFGVNNLIPIMQL